MKAFHVLYSPAHFNVVDIEALSVGLKAQIPSWAIKWGTYSRLAISLGKWFAVLYASVFID